METISISKFKATCLAVLERVKRTGKRIQITKFGEPIAEVIPPTPASRSSGWLGSMKSTGKIKGNIVNPVVDREEWEVFQE